MIVIIQEYLVYFGAVAAFAFPLIYLKSNWRATVIGKHMMFYTIAVALIFVLSLTNRFFGTDWPAHDWFSLIVITSFVALLWHRLILLIWVRHDPRKFIERKK